MKSPNKTMREAFEWLRVSPPTGYKLINSNKLDTYLIGRRRYTTEEALLKCRKMLENEVKAEQGK